MIRLRENEIKSVWQTQRQIDQNCGQVGSSKSTKKDETKIMARNKWHQEFAVVAISSLMVIGSNVIPAYSSEPDTKISAHNIGGNLTEEAGGGVIKGVVKFEGRQAKRKALAMGADPVCAAAHGDVKALRETFVFGDNNTLQNVFVYISKGLEGQTFPASTKEAILDQRGCVYTPHVLGVVVGQPIKVLNSDDTVHNVHTQPKINTSFNKAQVPGAVLNTMFEDIEMGVSVKCDVHPWMKGYVHVMEHPFFAITQQDGTFEIKGVPPGNYELATWHEFPKFKPDKKAYKVAVVEGQTTEITVTYKPPTRK